MTKLCDQKNRDNPLVSVIVPVFQAEQYLQRCIDALVSQTYQNTELIFVDDGSTDESQQILIREREKTDNIVIINQNNSGPSAARNKGLQSAHGEWIMFCDSDDIVEPQWIQTLLDVAIKNPLSWVMCRYTEVGKKGDGTAPAESVTRLCKDNYFDVYNQGLSAYVWNKIYCKELIDANDIQFDEKLSIGEDVEFNIQYYSRTEDILIINEHLYWYNRENNKSITKHAVYGEATLYLYRLRKPYIREQDIQKFNKRYWNQIFSEFIHIPKRPRRERNEAARRILFNDDFQRLLQENGKEELHPLAFRMLRAKRLAGFDIIQGISKIKHRFAQKAEK